MTRLIRIAFSVSILLIACGDDSGSNSVNIQSGHYTYFKASNSYTNTKYGKYIAMTDDTLVVSSFAENSDHNGVINGTSSSTSIGPTAVGAVYVYRKENNQWVQEAYLKAANSDGLDLFGLPVAISGDTIVVGAFQEDSNQNTITNGPTASSNNSLQNAGAAYVFKRTGHTWVQEAYLKPSNIDALDYFGISVAISGDTIVVGASGEDSNQNTITNGPSASSNNSGGGGAAYVFKRTGSNWVQEAYIKPSNGPGGVASFGYSVAISSDTIVVGAPDEFGIQTTVTNGPNASTNFDMDYPRGAAYVYKRTGNNWAQEAYLKASVSAEAGFGTYLSLDGDTVAVGSLLASSRVFIFVRSGVIWSLQAALQSSNYNSGDNFAFVALKGDALLVGASGEASNQTTVTSTASANNSKTLSGAAYLFKRSGTEWQQKLYIKSPNAEAYDYFGQGVAISDNELAIGAIGEASDSNEITVNTASSDNSQAFAGAAYVFKYSN